MTAAAESLGIMTGLALTAAGEDLDGVTLHEVSGMELARIGAGVAGRAGLLCVTLGAVQLAGRRRGAVRQRDIRRMRRTSHAR